MDRSYKHLETISVLFVAVLLISNIASTKIAKIGLFTLDGGTVLFPLTYIFNDVLTEVYGYAKSRKVIWLGFTSAIIMSLVFYLVGVLPAAEGWENQSSYDVILGQTPRIVIASLTAYFCGEFVNSYILARLKIITNGRLLWVRTISSTVVGQLIDSVIFVLIAFYGILSSSLVFDLIIFNYLFKTGVEVVFTPLTYKVVGFLKKAESEDYYDKKTNFNPFKS